MANNLDEVKAELYKIFNEAVEKHGNYSDRDYASNNYPLNLKIENRKVISDLAQAIVAVEKEQRENKDRGYNKLEKN
jgi:hypothetical protein